jgi:hypothetical protein
MDPEESQSIEYDKRSESFSVSLKFTESKNSVGATVCTFTEGAYKELCRICKWDSEDLMGMNLRGEVVLGDTGMASIVLDPYEHTATFNAERILGASPNGGFFVDSTELIPLSLDGRFYLGLTDVLVDHYSGSSLKVNLYGYLKQDALVSIKSQISNLLKEEKRGVKVSGICGNGFLLAHYCMYYGKSMSQYYKRLFSPSLTYSTGPKTLMLSRQKVFDDTESMGLFVLEGGLVNKYYGDTGGPINELAKNPDSLKMWEEAIEYLLNEEREYNLDIDDVERAAKKNTTMDDLIGSQTPIEQFSCCFTLRLPHFMISVDRISVPREFTAILKGLKRQIKFHASNPCMPSENTISHKMKCMCLWKTPLVKLVNKEVPSKTIRCNTCKNSYSMDDFMLKNKVNRNTWVIFFTGLLMDTEKFIQMVRLAFQYIMLAASRDLWETELYEYFEQFSFILKGRIAEGNGCIINLILELGKCLYQEFPDYETAMSWISEDLSNEKSFLFRSFSPESRFMCKNREVVIRVARKVYNKLLSNDGHVLTATLGTITPIAPELISHSLILLGLLACARGVATMNVLELEMMRNKQVWSELFRLTVTDCFILLHAVTYVRGEGLKNMNQYDVLTPSSDYPLVLAQRISAAYKITLDTNQSFNGIHAYHRMGMSDTASNHLDQADGDGALAFISHLIGIDGTVDMTDLIKAGEKADEVEVEGTRSEIKFGERKGESGKMDPALLGDDTDDMNYNLRE